MKNLLLGFPTALFLSILVCIDCSAQEKLFGGRGSGAGQTLTAPEARATPPGLAVSDVPAETPSTHSKKPITPSEAASISIANSSTGKTVDATPNNLVDDDSGPPLEKGFRWREATKQTLMFLTIQHGYAFTQPKTQSALKGKFWKDYASSVKSLRGWSDGGRFFTNYVAHPMQGAFLGYIQIQNDPKGIKQQFGSSGDYWRSRMKAMAWSAAWSTQFEIGPISQASIGNVGLKGKQTYIDIVITPTVGTGWLIAEDAMDRYLIKRIERNINNPFVKIFSRMLLNPTRTVANIFRLKTPWHRDRRRDQAHGFSG